MSQLPVLTAARIVTDRVLLRKARDRDRERFIELQTDPAVWAHLGGPRLRESVERHLDEIGGPANATVPAGVFVIADKASDDLLGTLEIKRRPADLPGHVTDHGDELEPGYLLRRDVWGAPPVATRPRSAPSRTARWSAALPALDRNAGVAAYRDARQPATALTNRSARRNARDSTGARIPE